MFPRRPQSARAGEIGGFGRKARELMRRTDEFRRVPDSYRDRRSPWYSKARLRSFTAAAVFRPFFVQMTFAHIKSKRLQTGTPGWTLGVKGLRKLDT